MNLNHIVNAWRDDEYRESLNADIRAGIPESPIGEIDLSDLELAEVSGGAAPESTPATPIVTGIFSAALSATISIASNWCVSYFDGGTCNQSTSGCC